VARPPYEEALYRVHFTFTFTFVVTSRSFVRAYRVTTISTKIRTRRLNLAGHCARHPEEAASNLVLWYQIGVAEEGDARLAPSSTL